MAGWVRAHLALRQARGELLVFVDVDMVLLQHFLECLHRNHFASDQRTCVVGQMVDYDNNTDVADVVVRPFEDYRGLLAELERSGDVRVDARLDAEHVIPWAFAWTALIALPRSIVVEQDLFFDLGFEGYGVEDLEWPTACPGQECRS